MDVLNNAIETLMDSCGREQWTPSVISISDVVMQADQIKVSLVTRNSFTLTPSCWFFFLSFKKSEREKDKLEAFP